MYLCLKLFASGRRRIVVSPLRNSPPPPRQKGGGLTPSKQPKTWQDGLVPRVLLPWGWGWTPSRVGCGRWVVPRSGRRAWGARARRGTETRSSGSDWAETRGGPGPSAGRSRGAPPQAGCGWEGDQGTEVSAHRPAEDSLWAGARRATAGALCPSRYFPKMNSL